MRVAILSLVVVVACGGGDDDGGGGGGGGEPTVVLMDTVGPEGGTFDGDGVSVEFPADAVSEPLEFMITSSSGAVAGYTRYSPVFTFEPRDTAFEGGIAVELDASAADGTFYWTGAGSDTYDVVDGEYIGEDRVAATVDHFGRGFVGKPGETGGSCGDGPACTAPDICLEGVCTPYDPP